MAIPKEFIQDLLARTDIVDLINRRVPLKKAGSNYIARCPFHSEKTPSFNVSAPKQVYHCFGCGAHGNAISFLMSHDHLEFQDAIEELAQYLGVPIPQELSKPSEKPLLPLYHLMEKITHYFHTQLKRSATAKAYLLSRGLTENIITHFKIGFAPSGWDHLLHQFASSEELKQALLKTGMLIKNDQGKIYDRFRNRIIVPIRDSRGRVIAFGGRTLDQEIPKYLNSPETPLFHKSNELYGLYEAQQSKVSLSPILIVEGYMDVIALHQFGITSAVGTLGTATNQIHLQRLFRYTKDLIFCFDGDPAGTEAAWRALEVSLPLLKDGIQIRFMFLPNGQDPDSFIRQEGEARFKKKMEEALPLTDFFFEKLCSKVNMDTLDGKAKLAELAKGLILKINNGVFQTLMMEKLASLLGLEKKTLEHAWDKKNHENSNQPPLPSAPEIPPYRTKSPTPYSSLAPIESAISLALRYPQIAQELELPAKFSEVKLPGSQTLQKIFDLLKNSPGLSTGALLEYWRNSKLKDKLGKLATWESIVPEQGVKAELADILNRILALDREQTINTLFIKGKENSTNLSSEEKKHLLELIQEKR